ncbi:uncharacterized protein EAF02_003069 [Botrytis sinoallii]|uniref:uncharacterized protein n=1 Tax=Botrytis sinoallii TaxID=1463999 RepID=UPI001901597F|nr:uncharacterized protein EAF02_003069 [Botrytis sinoallii]KAF7888528.1 hypothetical protein EAF02_003069 [Botrytis sinoallii]
MFSFWFSGTWSPCFAIIYFGPKAQRFRFVNLQSQLMSIFFFKKEKQRTEILFDRLLKSMRRLNHGFYANSGVDKRGLRGIDVFSGTSIFAGPRLAGLATDLNDLFTVASHRSDFGTLWPP